MLRVGIIGLGLTGSAIARHILEARPEMQVVLAGAGPASTKAGQDLGTLLDLPPCGTTIVAAEDIPEALQATQPHVVIDFSRAEATIALLPRYARLGCGVVVGATDFSEAQLKQLRNAAGTQCFSLMYAAHITRGVNVLMLIAKLAAGHYTELAITHHTESPPAFAAVAAEAAAWISRRRGYYTVEDMIMNVDVADMLIDEIPEPVAHAMPARLHVG